LTREEKGVRRPEVAIGEFEAVCRGIYITIHAAEITYIFGSPQLSCKRTEEIENPNTDRFVEPIRSLAYG
jgi:hypothetical protein